MNSRIIKVRMILIKDKDNQIGAMADEDPDDKGEKLKGTTNKQNEGNKRQTKGWIKNKQKELRKGEQKKYNKNINIKLINQLT